MPGPAMLECTGAHSFLEYQNRAAWFQALFGSEILIRSNRDTP
jgi:hypothetical protein